MPIVKRTLEASPRPPASPSSFTWWWLSTPQMTVLALERDGHVADAAPVVRRFVGQPWSNLIRWLESQGRLTVEKIAQP